MSEVVPAPGRSSPPPRSGVPVWLQRTLIGFAGLAVAFVIVLALLPLFFDGESFRQPLEQAIARATRREVVLGRLELRTLGGFGLRADQVRLVNSEGIADVQARSAFLEVSPLPLLAQRVEVRQIELEGAEINARRYRDGRWNFSDLGATASAPDTGVDLSNIGIKLFDSVLLIEDTAVEPNQRFAVTDLSVDLPKLDRRELPVTLQGRLTNQLREKPVATAITLEGTLAWPEDGNWQKLGGNLRILAEKFRPRYLSAYTRNNPALAGLTGVFDLDFTWQGQFGGNSRLEGNCGVRLLRWDWPAVFAGTPWLARKVSVEAKLDFTADRWQADLLRLVGTNLDATVQGSLTPTAGPQAPPLVDVTIKTNPIDPYALRENLPVALLPEALRGWVKDSKGSGLVRAELALRGSFDQLWANGNFEFQNFSLTNPRLRGALAGVNGRLALTDAAYELADLRIGPTGQEATVNGTIARSGAGAVNLQITGSNADLVAFSNLAGGRFGRLGGRAKLDLALNGTLAEPNVQGRAQLLTASLQRPDWSQALANIRGEVLFEPEKLTLTGLQAELGNSSLSIDGTVAGYGTAAASPQLAITSSDLDLKAAYSLLASDVFEGGFRRAFKSTFRSLAGSAAVDLKLQGSVTTGKIELQGASVGLEALGWPLEGAVGTLNLDERGINLEQLRATTASSPITLRGFIGRYGDAQLGGEATLNFPAAATLVLPGSRGGIRARGSVPVSFSLEGRRLTSSADLSGLSELSVGAVDLTPARRLALTGTVGSTSFSVDDASRLELADLELALGGTVSNLGRKDQRYALRLRSEAAFDLGQLARYVPPLADLGLAGGAPVPLDLRIVGSTPSIEATLPLSGASLPGVLGGINDLQGPLNLEANRASTPGLAFRLSDGTSGRISGSLTNFQDPSLSFDVRFDRLNLDSALAATAGGDGQLRNLRGTGSVQIGAGMLSRFNFADLTGQAKLEKGLWSISNLSAAVADGRLTGTLTADLRNIQSSFKGDVRFAGADANQLATVLLGFGNQVAGATDLEVTFQSVGNNPDAFLENLSGSGQITIRGGRLTGSDILSPLFGPAAGSVRALNPGRFDLLQGSFKIDGGIASGENFNYDAANLLLRLSGNLSLLNREANLRARGEFLRPSANLAALIRRLGNGLTGFSFEIAGPITQPGSLRDLRWIEPLPASDNRISVPTEGATSTP